MQTSKPFVREGEHWLSKCTEQSVRKLTHGERELVRYFSAKTNAHTPIRHVIYVIKENRTYDQVLGDMTEGNGAPDLVLFGESVTPNHHALARQFVLFDNFYVDGDVSADGHVWSTAASSTDYVNKLWPSFYAHRLKYDFVGPDYDGDDQHDHPIAIPRSGFIWDRGAEGRRELPGLRGVVRGRRRPSGADSVLRERPEGPL